MLELEKYSFGLGDRFGMEGNFQLEAVMELEQKGVTVIPVWNKSHREHLNTSTQPATVLAEAESSTAALNWSHGFHVDADHISRHTVMDYIDCSDYFTIDVAEQIGNPSPIKEMDRWITSFLDQIKHLDSLEFSREEVSAWGLTYGRAAAEAGEIYRMIQNNKDHFIAEVSMDEVESAQSPRELFFILYLLKINGVNVQTIAPKFPGRFNKGIDYIGDVSAFETHFETYVQVIQQAIDIFDLPPNLKLSIHTGSDKFSLYPVIGKIIRKYDAGIHLKTAGTTWLEEAAGLAEAGETSFISGIYARALERYDELTASYKDVLSIERNSLPAAQTFSVLDAADMSAAIRHDQSNTKYDSNVRQLMHTAYKIAAENGDELRHLIKKHRNTIGEAVRKNILTNHLIPLFL